VIPLLQLAGEASLDSATFAEVKAEFYGE